MKLCDVNILVYAHRPDANVEHTNYAHWLTALATGVEAFALSEAVLSGFIRVVTNPRIFKDPTPINTAIAFCEQLRRRQQACVLKPGKRNWSIFTSLCSQTSSRGKLVADAWHAALAIEYDCLWMTTDSDFSRFPGLNWSHPLTSI